MVVGVLISKPGITSASTLSIPKDWSPSWFRNLIENQLKGADVRNAVGSGGISVSGNIASPYATISYVAPQRVWNAPILSPNISNLGSGFNPAGYLINGEKEVTLRGLVTGTGLTSGSTIFTLPAGFRPPNTYSFGLVGSNGTAQGIWRIDITPAGVVEVDSSPPIGTTGNPTGYLFLDGISFYTY